MQQLSRIYSRNRMGFDNKVWLTLLLTVLLSAGLLGFRIATTEPCYEARLNLKGVVAHARPHYYFVGESIIFQAGMKRLQDVSWDFGDGSPAATGVTVTHSYKQEGNFLVTATINGRCLQSVNVHISPIALATPVTATPSANGEGAIIGKDFAAAGELAIYQTGMTAGAYEWTIENNTAFPPKPGNKVSYSFTEPGSYVLKLKLDNDETKVYRKTITISMNPADAHGANVDELPPLPLPAPPGEGTAAGAGESGPVAEPAPAEKKIELIPDAILKNQLQDVIEGKETLENIAQYMCPGGKIKGNGTIYANLNLFGETLKGKKGMLGLGGKRKIKSVHANREVGSNCIFRLDVEYK
ncbi:PKD domain-containing protein [Taibaiella koreensis]|uniref:PKD domain-containing protein n=1 Tax=Taibaiella koreensis TaxID=1268548 RepID=UPI000E59ADD6|nr:PKD domain-containing protein [Taibaiella koreensis]